jgi:hypothetical protein
VIRDDKELFAIFLELRDHYPQWRFGQLIANLAGSADVDIWDVEDDQLHAAAGGHLDFIAQQRRTGELYAPVS